jgi:hypothetical protein
MNLDPSEFDDDADVDPEEIESAASERITPDTAPEVDRKTEDLKEWDEPPTATGVSAPKVPMEDETSVSEELIEEGMEEADREQRIASADPDFEP